MEQSTLHQIVARALESADRHVKLASSSDADHRSGDFLADLDESLKVAEAPPFVTDPKRKSKKDDEEEEDEDKEKTSSISSFLEMAEEGMKIAEALELGSSIVSAKLAADIMTAPGPAITKGDFIDATTAHPKAQATVTDKMTGGAQAPAGLPTNKEDFTSVGDESGAADNHPGKTAGWSKAAFNRLLQAKLAEAETLMKLGQHEAASRLLDEIKESTKVAQDPSSPQPVISAGRGDGGLDTSEGSSSHVPDNSGMISMTQAAARDKTTREATQYFSEPPKRDNAVAAHTLRTDGLKLSAYEPVRATTTPQAPQIQVPPTETPKTASAQPVEIDPEVARAYIRSAIKTASDPHADPNLREKAAGVVRGLRDRLGVDPATLLDD